ncbi:beta-N-acetylhexosaminidase [Williamsia sterculiae]|uniref:beta-N-acetylhexosaminidase n=1 Tax=Williamsia sterculiae TaxID=1344003 RepID=A0A1N7CEW7_9NOCA|nr:beta-N-acetylhexosaminidase [Williamsia sterculiae]
MSTVASSARSSSVTSSSPRPTPAAAPVDCVGRTMATMSVRDKLAQLLTVGVSGAADARSVVAQSHVGGIFVGSFTDRSMLTNGGLATAKKASPLPLMVTVDQEGGRVSRLRSLGVDSPSARELAASQSPAQVRATARGIGAKLKRLGITVDFAPDADVSDESADEVIGDRSFSDDPQTVARYADAFATGLGDAGIMPVFKHFPGHGHGSGDSHTGTVLTPPFPQLIRDDLMPYKTLVTGTEADAHRGIMVGHLIVPGLTGPDTPASISPKAMALLRSGTGYGGKRFDGPIFTDDLSGMAAITAKYGVVQAVKLALTAGADVALWLSTDQVPAVLDSLQAAVRSGGLSQARVDASVRRVLTAKGLTC